MEFKVNSLQMLNKGLFTKESQSYQKFDTISDAKPENKIDNCAFEKVRFYI